MTAIFEQRIGRARDRKRPVAQWLLMMAIGAGAAMGVAQVARAQAPSAAVSAEGAAEEKEACIKNLKVIYAAIQAYQADHHDLPNWLSDLVPQYLADANVLMCPVCRRTGKTEGPPLADPKLPSSYLFEFCPVPLGGAAGNAPTRTRREWKRRQMGLIGSQVPVVRCRHHSPVLNLAFDGRIYESPSSWEWVFTNRVSAAELSAARLFAAETARSTSAPKHSATAARFPDRDPRAGSRLLDLTGFYNGALNEDWHGNRNNSLAALPAGLQTLGGVEFDVRGVIQLCSQSPSSTNYPAMVKGIPVHQRCERLQFLHAAGFGNPWDEGKQVGLYVVHFAANPLRLEIPIRYGHEVRNWHTQADEAPAPEDLRIVWTGENAVSKSAGQSLRLFLTTWTNSAPELEIQSLDFVSSMAVPAPFLIAVSAQ